MGASEEGQRIMFLIRSLNRGGAERQLVNLAIGLKKKGVPVSVAVYYAGGDLAKELEASGVQVYDLKKGGKLDFIPFLRRLVALIRSEKPAILHSYMASSNLAAVWVKRSCPAVRIVWGVRSSQLSQQNIGFVAKAICGVEIYASRWADLIITNSQIGREDFIQKGVRPEKMVTVPNGIDIERFKPTSSGRFRAELGVPQGGLLMGIIGRHDALKNHELAVKALSEATRTRKDLYLVCIGRNVDDHTEKLKALASELGVSEHIFWLEERTDIPQVLNDLDLLVCSSLSEGFPNVVAEAMSCGSPCVVTNVGDCALIVDGCGEVCATFEPVDFSAAILRMVSRVEADREGVRSACRERVAREYTVDQLIERSQEALHGGSNKLDPKRSGDAGLTTAKHG